METMNNLESMKKEELLQMVAAQKFGLLDINLFLDTHPDDKQALALHNKYVTDFNNAKRIYEMKYGPLTSDNIVTEWNWVSTRWPWEGVR